MKSTKTIAIVLIAMVLLGVLGVLIWKTMTDTSSHEEMQTFVLGTAKSPGYIGAEVTYDVEPVDVALTSPSGRIYARDYVEVYAINPNTKTITILADSDEIGEWRMTMNTKKNKSLNFKFVHTTSPTLYIESAEIVKEDDKFYIRFRPLKTVTNDESCNYTLTLLNTSLGYNKQISEGVTKLNEYSYILLNPPEDAYTGDEYTIRLTIYTPDAPNLPRIKDTTIKLAKVSNAVTENN